MHRRRLLRRVIGVSSLGTISGCSGEDPLKDNVDSDEDKIDATLSITGEWPLYRSNPQNTGSTPDAVGPSSRPSIEWASSLRNPLPTTYLSVIKNKVLAAQRGWIYVFDLETGSVLWKRNPDSKCSLESTKFSPVAGGNIYQTFYKDYKDVGVIAYSAKTGRKNWEYKLPDDGKCHGVPGFGADRESVYFVDSNGYAYSISKDGKQQWRVETAATEIYSDSDLPTRIGEAETPLQKPPVTGEENVYLYLKSGIIHAFNKNDGSEQWTHHLTIDHGNTNGNKQMHNKNHIVHDMAGGIAIKNDIVCFSYRLENRGDEEERHYSKIKTLDKSTGNRLWELTLASGTGIPSTPVIFDNHIYVFSNDDYKNYNYKNFDIDLENGDDFNLMSISLATGNLEWGAHVGNNNIGREEMNFAPALTDQHIYVATEHDDKDTRRIVCLDRSSGDKIWKFITEHSLAGPPVASDNRLIFATEGDQVICLK